MQELPRALFDVYALALPHGHGFGRRPPISAWQSEDGFAFGVVTRHAHSGHIRPVCHSSVNNEIPQTGVFSGRF